MSIPFWGCKGMNCKANLPCQVLWQVYTAFKKEVPAALPDLISCVEVVGKGDDEFPAESKILFDRTIIEHLALDIIFALAVEICTRVAYFPIDETKRR